MCGAHLIPDRAELGGGRGGASTLWNSNWRIIQPLYLQRLLRLLRLLPLAYLAG